AGIAHADAAAGVKPRVARDAADAPRAGRRPVRVRRARGAATPAVVGIGGGVHAARAALDHGQGAATARAGATLAERLRGGAGCGAGAARRASREVGLAAVGRIAVAVREAWRAGEPARGPVAGRRRVRRGGARRARGAAARGAVVLDARVRA